MKIAIDFDVSYRWSPLVVVTIPLDSVQKMGWGDSRSFELRYSCLFEIFVVRCAFFVTFLLNSDVADASYVLIKRLFEFTKQNCGRFSPL